MTALMSQSLKVVSSAALSCAPLSRFAIVWRIRVILTRSSLRSPEAGAEEVAACAGAASAIVSDPLFLAFAAASTSSLVRRPSRPVPLMVDGSSPCSSTARRTAGFSALTASEGASFACVFGVSPERSCWPSSRSSFARPASSPLAAGAPPSSMTAITAPTSTVSPTSAFNSPITPATGEGTSTATLSVSRLAIGSSTATASPGFFSHSPIVPSVTDSPRVGTVISLDMRIGPQALLLEVS